MWRRKEQQQKTVNRNKSGMYKNVLVQFYFAESLQQQNVKIAQVSFLSLMALSQPHTHKQTVLCSRYCHNKKKAKILCLSFFLHENCIEKHEPE